MVILKKVRMFFSGLGWRIRLSISSKMFQSRKSVCSDIAFRKLTAFIVQGLKKRMSFTNNSDQNLFDALNEWQRINDPKHHIGFRGWSVPIEKNNWKHGQTKDDEGKARDNEGDGGKVIE